MHGDNLLFLFLLINLENPTKASNGLSVVIVLMDSSLAYHTIKYFEAQGTRILINFQIGQERVLLMDCVAGSLLAKRKNKQTNKQIVHFCLPYCGIF